MLYLIISFSTNSSLVGPCSLASLSHAQPPCSRHARSLIFPGLRRRSYAKQAKLRHYPLANQRFLRSVTYPMVLYPIFECFLKCQSPASELRALVLRSLIRNRTEMLVTHSRNRVLVCSGIRDSTDRAKIKQNKQTNKKRGQGQRGH